MMKPLRLLLVASLLASTTAQAAPQRQDLGSFDEGAVCPAPSPDAQNSFEEAAGWKNAGMQFYKSGEYQDSATCLEQSLRWFRQAAQKGHPDAQYHLGAEYEGGYLGLPKNKAEAMRWLHQAAQQGHDDAKRHYEALAADQSSTTDSFIETWAWSDYDRIITFFITGYLAANSLDNVLHRRPISEVLETFKIATLLMCARESILFLVRVMNGMKSGLPETSQPGSQQNPTHSQSATILTQKKKKKRTSDSTENHSSRQENTTSGDTKPKNQTIANELTHIRHLIWMRNADD
jgi:TPR repeat protein